LKRITREYGGTTVIRFSSQYKSQFKLGAPFKQTNAYKGIRHKLRPFLSTALCSNEGQINVLAVCLPGDKPRDTRIGGRAGPTVGMGL
jgi:hypothetical protein